MPNDETLRFYAENAATYAARADRAIPPQLSQFLAALPQGASILELGTGSGRDARHMRDAGFAVTPTDGSPELAAEAEKLIGIPVRVMLFEDLDEREVFEGVYASASLLHARRENLAGILARVHRALKPGGLFWASYKSGAGEGHDSLGRYYNYPSEPELRAAYQTAAPWQSLAIEQRQGSGYDNLPTEWLSVTARK